MWPWNQNFGRVWDNMLCHKYSGGPVNSAIHFYYTSLLLWIRYNLKYRHFIIDVRIGNKLIHDVPITKAINWGHLAWCWRFIELKTRYWIKSGVNSVETEIRHSPRLLSQMRYYCNWRFVRIRNYVHCVIRTTKVQFPNNDSGIFSHSSSANSCCGMSEEQNIYIQRCSNRKFVIFSSSTLALRDPFSAIHMNHTLRNRPQESRPRWWRCQCAIQNMSPVLRFAG